MKIGFIGLGNVGGKLAGSLLRNKFDLIVRDLDENLTKPFVEQGAKFANTGDRRKWLHWPTSMPNAPRKRTSSYSGSSPKNCS